MNERCHCGGVFARVGGGVVPIVRCMRCDREIPYSALRAPFPNRIDYVHGSHPEDTMRDGW